MSALPLIVIIVVLFLRGKALPVRGTVEEQRLPLSPYPVRVAQHVVVWITVAIFFAFVFENSGIRTVFAGAIQTSLVFVIVMLSLVVLTGYTGQISLFQMSLAGVAAFFMARMMADGSGQGTSLSAVSGPGLPWPLAALAGHHRRRPRRAAASACPRCASAACSWLSSRSPRRSRSRTSTSTTTS